MKATHSTIMCLHNSCSQNLTLHIVCKIRTNKMHGKILPYSSLSCGQQLTLQHHSIHIHTVQYSYIQYAFSTSYVNFKNSTEKLYIYITYGQENEIVTTMTKYYELWLVKFHGTDELFKIECLNVMSASEIQECTSRSVSTTKQLALDPEKRLNKTVIHQNK